MQLYLNKESKENINNKIIILKEKKRYWVAHRSPGQGGAWKTRLVGYTTRSHDQNYSLDLFVTITADSTIKHSWVGGTINTSDVGQSNSAAAMWLRNSTDAMPLPPARIPLGFYFFAKCSWLKVWGRCFRLVESRFCAHEYRVGGGSWEVNFWNFQNTPKMAVGFCLPPETTRWQMFWI